MRRPSLRPRRATEIAEVLRRSPFRSFVIVMSDGGHLPVTTPDMAGGNPRAVHWCEQAEPFRVVRLDPARITQIIEE